MRDAEAPREGLIRLWSLIRLRSVSWAAAEGRERLFGWECSSPCPPDSTKFGEPCCKSSRPQAPFLLTPPAHLPLQWPRRRRPPRPGPACWRQVAKAVRRPSSRCLGSRNSWWETAQEAAGGHCAWCVGRRSGPPRRTRRAHTSWNSTLTPWT